MSTSTRPPVLLVHGMWGRGRWLGMLRKAIERRGGDVETIDLVPNDGRAPIRVLARQLEARAEEVRAARGVERIDLVGFSMGALVSRTYIQRLGGRDRVRRFISISGPHAGTLGALALPFDGTKDMRPGSELLKDLGSDPDPWGDVEVHVLYSSLDLMVFPPATAELPGARTTRRIPMPIHRMMIVHPHATGTVAELLAAER